LQKSWQRICDAAGLENFRIHDLRHSFATISMENGENLASISRVLGHASLQMTQRYLHVHDQSTLELVERTAGILS
jgi:integrase